MKVVLFTAFLVAYLITLLTNLGMIILFRADSQLHTPMYFFLSHLLSLTSGDNDHSTTLLDEALPFIPYFSSYCGNSSVYIESISQSEGIHVASLFGDLPSTILETRPGCAHLCGPSEAKAPDNLSFSDLSYSIAVGPKMLVDLLTKNKSIPFLSCALQFFIFCTFTDAECMLLAVMAFDRYKAISRPLSYAVDLSSRVCSQLLAGVYLVGLADALTHTSLTFRLCFCGSNEINHFFCDIPPVLSISCSDTQVNVLVIFTIFGFIELSTISGVLISYCYIISSVLKIRSAEGRLKAFSTCASHLTALSIFQYMLFMYFWPSSSYSLDQDKIISLFYTLFIPMLNPLIYSLRNKDVKKALQKLRNKILF